MSRIKINIIVVNVQVCILFTFIELIIGNINAISTSKIKKIIAIKKNWIEKGNRDELKGSNPHSKGVFFSRSKIVFLDKILAKIITIIAIKVIINIIVIRI